MYIYKLFDDGDMIYSCYGNHCAFTVSKEKYIKSCIAYEDNYELCFDFWYSNNKELTLSYRNPFRILLQIPSSLDDLEDYCNGNKKLMEKLLLILELE
ncbi:MAG: hypothetical protein LC122_14300 [Chitinophagales bacterium]|nr:hypothetical protein [Chitinophagales bacterium]